MLLIFDDFKFESDWEQVLIYTSLAGIGLSMIGLLLTIGADIFIAILSSKKHDNLTRIGMITYKNMSDNYLRIFTKNIVGVYRCF